MFLAERNPRAVSLQTATGDTCYIEPMAYGPTHDRDFSDTRYLTADCPNCPLHITAEELRKNEHRLRAIIGGFSLPEWQMGICAAGMSVVGSTIRKYLEVRAAGLHRCTNPTLYGAWKRAQQLKQRGLWEEKS